MRKSASGTTMPGCGTRTRLTRSSTRSPSESVDHWIETINKAGCPCGRVMTLAEVFNDPQIISQEMVIAYEQPGRGTVRVTGFPMKLSTRPARLGCPRRN